VRDGKIPDRPRATRPECMGARSLQAGDHQVWEAGQEVLKVREDQAAQVKHGLDMQPPQVSGGSVPDGEGKEGDSAESVADTQS
jgi:hypothetical protein